MNERTPDRQADARHGLSASPDPTLDADGETPTIITARRRATHDGVPSGVSSAGKLSSGESNDTGFARRAVLASVIGAGVVAAGLLLWYAVDVLLLVFAGVLLGVLLRGLTVFVSERTKLGRGWSLAIVLLGILAVAGSAGWLLFGRVSQQATQLAESLPRAAEDLTARVRSQPWGERLIERIPAPNELLARMSGGDGGGVFGRVTGAASGVLGALVNVVIVLSVGIYLAAEPRLYRRGLLHLVPPRGRKRAGEVMGELDTVLGRWLVGRLVLMFVNGAITAFGLWLLGVPLALTLGILTGVLNFIPNFGPLTAGVPAVLIALLIAPQVALYTLLLYVAIQMLDGYVFTPLVDRRSVELPPVLTITAQVLLGVLVGSLGVVLASPLVASLLVIVQRLYVEDALGDESAGGST